MLDLGVIQMSQMPTTTLYSGQVGYVVLGMKSTKEALVGDTFFRSDNPIEPLPGFKTAKPMVFVGIYPVRNEIAD